MHRLAFSIGQIDVEFVPKITKNGSQNSRKNRQKLVPKRTKSINKKSQKIFKNWYQKSPKMTKNGSQNSQKNRQKLVPKRTKLITKKSQKIS